MKNVLIIAFLFLISCSSRQKQIPDEKGNDLNLKYEVLAKKNQFPNDSLNFYSGYLLVNIPKGSRYIDIAESIKEIGLKENMWKARVYTSKTGYPMEIDSISGNIDEYNKSFLGYYDLTTKGLNWKQSFTWNDIQFKGSLPVKIKVK